MPCLNIRPATADDVPTILAFIKELADYEKLPHEVIATEETLRQTLFGTPRYAEVLIGEVDDLPAGFALFFHNYSTWLAKPGLYLEDLYVQPSARGVGLGKALLITLAKLAVERGCGRLEWSVLDWNEPAIQFYQSLGATAMDEWTVNRVTGEALTNLAGRTL
ncbi:ribosomal protein S18 acetylase RimI-like enzyme [Pseudomonas duriflava]|uniref:Ribosomal protein S18 acetylase RimI-like enzyme n=1 Tax=Pseudomonas duriflava TaxID=459528 RepID=A0A562QFZ6_9PSED|nr:GNAT family N-acetyltransferase [Pseudomonas duriflava]TWI55661.1 ribosomal protein S18 acetylase RimI-like enzyme [Pseudomonas duriflava]